MVKGGVGRMGLDDAALDGPRRHDRRGHHERRQAHDAESSARDHQR
jgi:hypothetical protein